MKAIFRPAVFLLLGCCFWRPVPAAVDFADAAAARYSAEQLEFLKSFMAAKQASKESPVNTLVSTVLATLMSDSRPPMDFAALARDAGAGQILLEYAETLYGMAQYELAGEALAMVSPATQKEEAVRFESVRLRLALRGQGKLPAALSDDFGTPQLALNRALAAVRRGDIPAAIALLRKLAADAKASSSSRDRASLWLSILYAEKAEPRQALEALSAIDSGSPLVAEAALMTLRLSGEIHPAAASAVEQRLAVQLPDSASRWEAREHLIKALERRGAIALAGQQAMQAVGSLAASIGELDRSIAGLGKLSEQDLQSYAGSLPDDARARTDELLKRKLTLARTAELLRQWRPYFGIYQQRLQRDPNLFSDELRASIGSQWSRSGDDSKGGNPGELFRLELVNLLGSPPDREISYRLFFGLVQWEFDYEYPDTWRPVAERPVEETAGKRRRQREAAQKLEKTDQRMLPRAMGHIGKLRTKVDSQLKKQQTVVFKGMVERAKSISDRNAATVREIERGLPLIDEGIRAEVRQSLEQRRILAQRWLARFSGHAIALYAGRAATGQQPEFELGAGLKLKSGQSVVAGLQAVNGEPKLRAAEETDLKPLLAQLKTLSVSGGTRQIQSDALRLRARLIIALYEAQAIPSAAEAVENYATLLRNYSDLVDVADVRYQLARAQDLSAQTAESLASLSRFAKDFPEDSRASEALFRIGEAQFSLGEYSLARATYESVIKRKDARYLEQADYKLGWSLFKQGEYMAALPRFLAIVERRPQAAENTDRRQEERQKDSYRAVALTFAYMNGAAEVDRYFAKLGKRAYVPDIYVNLGRYYLEHDRIKDAADTYGYLVKLEPNDPRAPRLLGDIIAGAQAENLNKLVLEQQEKFIDTYGVSGTYWSKAGEGVRAEIQPLLKGYLASFGQMYHADAQETKRRESYDKAIRYYGEYVATFPNDPQTPRFHFLMAEAREEIGDSVAAKADFDAAAYKYSAHADAAAAGYAALVSSQKLAEKASTPDDRKMWLRELVSGSGQFAAAFPADTRVEAVLVKASEDMLMLGEPAEGVGYAERVLARKPAEPVRRRALLVVAHGRFDNKEFAKAEAAYTELLAEDSGSTEAKAKLRDRQGLSIYRQAEIMRQAGNYDQAVDTFLRVGKAAPGSDSVPNAEIDAAALLLQEKHWSRAVNVLERFLKTYPGHPLAQGVPTRLAYAYENDGQLFKAADMLETISTTETDTALARQMALRSGELRERGGRPELAAAAYERYLVRYPTPLDQATEVRQKLAEMAAKSDDKAQRLRWLSEVVVNASGIEGASVRVRYLAAGAATVLGDVSAAEFGAIPLKLPLDKALAAKRLAMERSLKWYEDAVRFGVIEVTTEANYKTAELYRDLARDVQASERPAGLNELEQGQYKILLEEQAAPIEDKAVDLHEINYGRLRNGIYDQWVKKSLASLRTLSAGKYDKVELAVDYFAYTPPSVAAPGQPPKVVGTSIVTPGAGNEPMSPAK